MNGAAREALRQQLLLRAVLGDSPPLSLAPWLLDSATPGGAGRGLAAYRANAGANAERALALAFPTVCQLLGEPAFAVLARAHWQEQPAVAGDLGLWGGGLADSIGRADALAGEPYLADVARLDWAVHQAERAADALPPEGLHRLADADPDALVLRLAPGTALVESAHPIVTVWQAHRSTAAGRFAPVQAAFAAGAGECALVERCGWRAVPRSLPADEARFTRAVLAGRTLASALDDAGAAFDFSVWWVAVLARQGLAAVDEIPARP